MGIIDFLTEILKLFNGGNRRVEALETRVDKLEGELMAIKDQVQQLTETIAALQTVIGEEVVELKNAIDALFARIKDLEGLDIAPQIATINDSINRVKALSDLTIEPDVTVPTTPVVSASATGETSATVTFTSTDNVGVVGFEVFQDGVSIGKPTSSPLEVAGLAAGTTYLFSARAFDKAGNSSAVSDAVSVTTPGTATPLTTANRDRSGGSLFKRP